MVRKGVGGYRDELTKGPAMRNLGNALERVYRSHDAFSMAPATLQFMALEQMGVESSRAAFIVRDDFDAAIKSKHHNTLATFYPFVGAAGNSAKNVIGRLSTKRGAGVFSAYTIAAISLYSLASSLSGDGDDGGSWMDSVSLKELTNSIPIRIGNSVIKIPVPFELPRMAWTLGASLHRLSRGEATAGEALGAISHALLREMQAMGLESIGEGDSLIGDILIAATPSAFSWATELAFNQNALGSRIHSQAARGQPRSEAGQTRTQDIWKDIAKNVRTYTGIDMYPESIRHTMTQVFSGGLAAITTEMESSSLYMAAGELSTRQELGPLGIALGLNSVWDNGNRYTVNSYYRNQDNATKLLDKYGVSWGEEGTKPGQAANALYGRMLEAGATTREAEIAMRAKEAETELSKAKRSLAKVVKDIKRIQLSPDTAAPDYRDFNEDRRNIMESFNRDYRRLK